MGADFRKQLLAADVSNPILMLRPVLSSKHTHATALLFFLTTSYYSHLRKALRD